jgi:transcriptional regulator with XRE-family HTH domain
MIDPPMAVRRVSVGSPSRATKATGGVGSLGVWYSNGYHSRMTQTIGHDAQRIARTLRDARAAAGLSLRELARRAGTSHATLSAYEQGRKIPSALTFLRILDAAGFAVDFELSRRVRERDGIQRGVELEQVLDLAAQFPARHRKTIGFPRLARK